MIKAEDIVRHKRNVKMVAYVEAIGDDDKAQVTYLAGGMTGVVPVALLEKLPDGERQRFPVWIHKDDRVSGRNATREEIGLVARILREAGALTQVDLTERAATELGVEFLDAASVVSAALARLCDAGGARYARRLAPCCRKGKKRTRHWSRLYEHVAVVPV